VKAAGFPDRLDTGYQLGFVPRIRQRGHRYTFYTLDRHRWIAGVCPSLGVGDRERTRKQSSVLRPLQWAQGCVFRLGNTWPSDSSMFSVSDRNFTFTARTPYIREDRWVLYIEFEIYRSPLPRSQVRSEQRPLDMRN
jgi:hypothetical protein